MKNFVFIGPAFAGKGTQCKLISNKYNLIHLSTGDAIRSEIKKGSPCGLKAQEFTEKGRLAPDDLLEEIVRSFVKDNKDAVGFLFDGYPRNIPQVTTLINILEEYNAKIDAFIILRVPYAILLERGIKRAEIEGRTDDKDPKIIQRRLEVYENSTKPIFEYIESRKFTVHKIDGFGTVDEVFARITDKMGE